MPTVCSIFWASHDKARKRIQRMIWTFNRAQVVFVSRHRTNKRNLCNYITILLQCCREKQNIWGKKLWNNKSTILCYHTRQEATFSHCFCDSLLSRGIQSKYFHIWTFFSQSVKHWQITYSPTSTSRDCNQQIVTESRPFSLFNYFFTLALEFLASVEYHFLCK